MKTNRMPGFTAVQSITEAESCRYVTVRLYGYQSERQFVVSPQMRCEYGRDWAICCNDEGSRCCGCSDGNGCSCWP